MYHLISVYLFTTELQYTCTYGIFFYITHICYICNGRKFTKSALRILVLSSIRVSSVNHYLFCSLAIHETCALCGIFTTIFVLLTTENTDDLKSGFRISQGHWQLLYISEFIMYHFVFVINCTRGHNMYPSPSLNNIRVMVIVLKLRGTIIRTALCWIVWHDVHCQLRAHLHVYPLWAVLTIPTDWVCHFGILTLCVEALPRVVLL